MKRNPKVAGQFYPGTKDLLKQEISVLLKKSDNTKTNAIGIIVPHAGYMYSGEVAASVYSLIKIRGEGSCFFLTGLNSFHLYFYRFYF